MVPVHAHVPNTWGAGVVGSRSAYKYKSACFVSGHSTNAKPHAPIAHRFAETKKNNESNHHTRVATVWPLHGTFKSRMHFWLAFPSGTICAETPAPPPRVSFHCNSRVCSPPGLSKHRPPCQSAFPAH